MPAPDAGFGLAVPPNDMVERTPSALNNMISARDACFRVALRARRSEGLRLIQYWLACVRFARDRSEGLLIVIQMSDLNEQGKHVASIGIGAAVNAL